MSAFKELKERERNARRKLIISAAQETFSKKDFRQVTAREIAKNAGVSPGTIYRYYRNMDELFLEIFLGHATELTEKVETEIRKNGSCSIRRFCAIHVEYLNDNMTFYQMMSHFMISDELPDEMSERIDPVMRRSIDQLENIFKQAGIKKDVRMKAHALFAALNGTMISYARYPGRTLKETKKHTLRLADIIAEQFQQ